MGDSLNFNPARSHIGTRCVRTSPLVAAGVRVSSLSLPRLRLQAAFAWYLHRLPILSDCRCLCIRPTENYLPSIFCERGDVFFFEPWRVRIIISGKPRNFARDDLSSNRLHMRKPRFFVEPHEMPLPKKTTVSGRFPIGFIS